MGFLPNHQITKRSGCRPFLCHEHLLGSVPAASILLIPPAICPIFFLPQKRKENDRWNCSAACLAAYWCLYTTASTSNMLPPDQSRQALTRLFHHKRVADLKALSAVLETSSRMSVFRRLSALGCFTSYSHNSCTPCVTFLNSTRMACGSTRASVFRAMDRSKQH